MIALGLILIVAGLLVPQLSVLFTIGIIVLVVGLIFLFATYAGRPVGGRRYWY